MNVGDHLVRDSNEPISRFESSRLEQSFVQIHTYMLGIVILMR